MKQKIIFTCLPHRIDAQNKLRFSVQVSLRLENAVSTTLSSFPDMENWPGKLKNASFKLRLKNGTEYDINLNSDLLDNDLWMKLMHKDIRVDGFQQEDLSQTRIHSYPIKHVQSFVLETYKRLGTKNPDRLIDPKDLSDPKSLGQISKFKKRDTPKPPESNATSSSRRVFKESDFLDVDESTSQRLEELRKKNGFVPFQKQANPKMDFAQFRDFHKTDRPTRYAPLAKIKKPEFEFHDILAVVSTYPQIQRKLGVVLDFSLDIPSGFPASQAMRLIIENIDFITNTEVSVPLTAYRYTEKGFYAQSKEDSDINLGFVKINTDTFTAFQIDTDGVAMKVNHMVDNKIQEEVKLKIVELDLGKSKRFKNAAIPADEPEKEGLPSLRSAGIGIARNGMGERLNARFLQAKQLQAKIIDPSKMDNSLKLILSDERLYAEDLVQGYRMDVAYASDPEKWHSLHMRKESYSYFDSSNVEEFIDDIQVDEGFIQTAAAEDTENANELFVGENMIRWEGWSLSVPKPGFAINEAEDENVDPSKRVDYVNTSKNVEVKKYQFDSTREFRLHTKTETVKGSLPRLRFGRDYMLRVRTVDLAGNSVPLESQPEKVSEAVIRGFRYYRYDALMNPVLLLGSELKDGEALEELVVRSNYNMTTDEFQERYGSLDASENRNATRHFLPPRNSQLIAEQHSKFDKAFGNNPEVAKALYELISSKEVQLEKGENGKEKVYKGDEVDLIYLPDPAAAGVALFLADGYDKTHSQAFEPRLFSFFGNAELSSNDTNISVSEDNWYKAKSLRIQLVEGSTSFDWKASERLLLVSLPKGERIKLRFSTFWREEDMNELSGMWQLLQEENPANIDTIKELARSGRHWMISPAREIELTHAVLQPVEAPQIEIINPDKNYDDTHAWLHTRFSVHGFSSHKVEYKARWKDRRDDPRTVEPDWVDHSDNVEEIDISYHDKSVDKGNLPKKKDPSKQIAIQGQNNQAKAQLQVSLASEFSGALKHKFGDTKHRYVDYYPEATTRYAEHFDKLIQSEGLEMTRDGEWMERVNILSSDRPKIPFVEYVIPTFEWRKTKSASVMRQHRLGGGLRVYLKRPWFSTGEDEMLAVLLPGSDPSKISQTIAALGGAGFNSMFTHWAQDPIRPSKPAGMNYPSIKDFRHNPTVDKALVYPGKEKHKVNAVAYPVEFDKERKLWYADFALNHGKMYFPFVKLALARYQPHSVRKAGRDVCLSSVVMADYIQLVPERIATLTFKKDNMNSRFTLQVEGVISNPLDRNGNTGNYLEISFLDPELVQPVYGSVSDGRNEDSLEEEGVSIPISGSVVKNNYFTVVREFKLSRKYKDQPLQVIVQEFERGPKGSGNIKSLATAVSEENQPKLVYADVFKINAPADKVKN
ncbi:hypothetical protein [Marinifilum caeruleilacunae]|uniref:Uncharacterized protein n=1 Tax=Marinifilum caeruleilacunae TaxID=2499076 RepID=A0ABX1WRD5_9BACT|nr:hypothetical protein [Marinifilum caeruleilacunae]NOU58645.1 hypothetical protein [Marinifilum caeruleilacunae]